MRSRLSLSVLLILITSAICGPVEAASRPAPSSLWTRAVVSNQLPPNVIAADPDNGVWLIGGQNCLACIDLLISHVRDDGSLIGQRTIPMGLAYRAFSAAVSADYLWLQTEDVSTHMHVLRVDRSTLTVENVEVPDLFTTLYTGLNNRVWASANDRIYVLNDPDSAMPRFAGITSIGTDSVLRGLVEAADHTLWVVSGDSLIHLALSGEELARQAGFMG